MDPNEGWIKSSRSQNGGNDCVEARVSPEGPQLSDSKLADNRPIITVDEATYQGLISAIKADSLGPNT